MGKRVHDYRDHLRGWGWDLSYRPIDGGKQLRATGWGEGLHVGDAVLLSNGSADTRYRVGDDLRYEDDPPDMWHVTLDFFPRPTPESR